MMMIAARGSVRFDNGREGPNAQPRCDSGGQPRGADQAPEPGPLPGQGPALRRPGGREEGASVAFHPIHRSGGDGQRLRCEAYHRAKRCEALDGFRHSLALGEVHQPAEAWGYVQHLDGSRERLSGRRMREYRVIRYEMSRTPWLRRSWIV
jgi:hypothetical protein